MVLTTKTSLNMEYLIDPSTLKFIAETINGYSEMVASKEIDSNELTELATEIAEEWTLDWDENQGFGSSDSTYMVKEFVDSVINIHFYKQYETTFAPVITTTKHHRLRVVKC